MKEQPYVDVLIIGAGLSGIGAAFHLQRECPNKSYAIVEARESMGGTWDLFRYPGIRSDSDMYTLGYSFRPWTEAKAIADGPSILRYIKDTAETYGIDKKIAYGQKVTRASWSSETARWTVDVLEIATGETLRYTCNFLYSCTGYYNYDQGYTPDFPGRESFKGQFVHPQKWTDDIVYENKRVVVIGSGATAVTLVPELAKKAAHVVMLQRSPTYILIAPENDRFADFLRSKIPMHWAYAATRWKNVLLTMAFYNFCRKFPNQAKNFFTKQVSRQLRGDGATTQDFTPRYNPWDQRVCLVPDADLFRTISSGRASVVTDQIESFTESGIKLKSGKQIDADIIVSATGLELKFMGGVSLEIDGKLVRPAELMTYKGMMCADVPNLAMAIGYTNASWTLKCDLICEYVCRLLKHMDQHGYTQAVPRQNNPAVKPEVLLDLSSGYVQRAIQEFPRQGSLTPWRVHQNYALDMMNYRYSRVDDGVMEFSRRAH